MGQTFVKSYFRRGRKVQGYTKRARNKSSRAMLLTMGLPISSSAQTHTSLKVHRMGMDIVKSKKNIRKAARRFLTNKRILNDTY